MNGDTPITDLSKYNQSMQKSMIDKIFFMDKVEADVFIDVGCADGALIKFLASNFPQHKYIGYDNDSKMIEMAYQNIDCGRHIYLTDSKEKLNEELSRYRLSGKKVCVILSSMILLLS